MKIRRIILHRSNCETPITLYDKSKSTNEEMVNLISTVFTSPKISIIDTSSSTIIFKPSKFDAIEIADEKIIPTNKLKVNATMVQENSEKVKITKEIEIDLKENPVPELEEEFVEEKLVIDEINIDTISVTKEEQ